MSHMHGPPITPGTPGGDDEIIPTAIVIKNIPFNVKRETLLDIIVGIPSLLLPKGRSSDLYVGIPRDPDTLRF